MFFNKYKYFITILISVVLMSCSKYQKYLKSSDYGLKYDKGVEYFGKKDYFRAIGLFEELENIYKGSEKAEKIQYYMAYCYYNQGDNILAGYYFKNFSERFPLSKSCEECDYMSAYCSYLNSPQPSLDQDYTRKAIEEMQIFLTKYPKSSRVSECNKIVDDLRGKLELKALNAAKLYYNVEDYKSAIIEFKNCLNDFPDTHFREEIMYLIVKSSYKLAENSVMSKKTERYQQTVDEYYNITAEFPDTKYLKEIKKIFEQSAINLKN